MSSVPGEPAEAGGTGAGGAAESPPPPAVVTPAAEPLATHGHRVEPSASAAWWKRAGRATWRWLRMLVTGHWNWVRVERTLLFFYLFVTHYTLYKRYGVELGHDSGAQMTVTDLITRDHLNPGLKECFNCWHPMLGFAIPKIFINLGLSRVEAAQVSSFVASLIAFFAFRAALRATGLLRKPVGIIMLYVETSIPLQGYLSYGITLDSFTHAWASIVLWSSVRLLWNRNELLGRPRRRWPWAIVLVLALSTAPLVKYTGFIAYSFPVFVGLVQGRGRWFKAALKGLALGILSLALVSPYYYFRYYKPTGSIFPANPDWMVPDEMNKSRAQRDAEGWRFFVEMLKKPDIADDHPNRHDDHVRLHDTWRLYWVRAEVIGWAGDTAYKVSKFYIHWMWPLMLVGAWHFARRARRGTALVRMGWVFTMVGVVELAAMVHQLHRFPYPGWIPGKPYYISPTLWTMSYALAFILYCRGIFPFFIARRAAGPARLVVLALFGFIVINRYLGIY